MGRSPGEDSRIRSAASQVEVGRTGVSGNLTGRPERSCLLCVSQSHSLKCLTMMATEVSPKSRTRPERVPTPGQGPSPFFAAPAASWWARITVLSRMSRSKSRSFSFSKTCSKMPLADQRASRLQTELQFPKRSGRSRQGAPVLAIQRLRRSGRPLPR